MGQNPYESRRGGFADGCRTLPEPQALKSSCSCQLGKFVGFEFNIVLDFVGSLLGNDWLVHRGRDNLGQRLYARIEEPFEVIVAQMYGIDEMRSENAVQIGRGNAIGLLNPLQVCRRRVPANEIIRLSGERCFVDDRVVDGRLDSLVRCREVNSKRAIALLLENGLVGCEAAIRIGYSGLLRS